MLMLTGDIVNNQASATTPWAVINYKLHQSTPNGYMKVGGNYTLRCPNRGIVVIRQGDRTKIMSLQRYIQKYMPIGVINGPATIPLKSGTITLGSWFTPTSAFTGKSTGIKMKLPDGTQLEGNLNGTQIQVVKPVGLQDTTWNVAQGQSVYVYDPPYFYDDWDSDYHYPSGYWGYNWNYDGPYNFGDRSRSYDGNRGYYNRSNDGYRGNYGGYRSYGGGRH